MKYSKEYQEYMKNITDSFINRLSHDSSIPMEEQYTPAYEKVGDEIKFKYSSTEDGNIFITEEYRSCLDEKDISPRVPKDVVESWWKIENECALKFLKSNTLTYDEWEKKFKPKVVFLEGECTDLPKTSSHLYTEEMFQKHLDDLKERMKNKNE